MNFCGNTVTIGWSWPTFWANFGRLSQFAAEDARRLLCGHPLGFGRIGFRNRGTEHLVRVTLVLSEQRLVQSANATEPYHTFRRVVVVHALPLRVARGVIGLDDVQVPRDVGGGDGLAVGGKVFFILPYIFHTKQTWRHKNDFTAQATLPPSARFLAHVAWARMESKSRRARARPTAFAAMSVARTLTATTRHSLLIIRIIEPRVFSGTEANGGCATFGVWVEIQNFRHICSRTCQLKSSHLGTKIAITFRIFRFRS
jgi:hypothetical protein